jgi:hypothetical protein
VAGGGGRGAGPGAAAKRGDRLLRVKALRVEAAVTGVAGSRLHGAARAASRSVVSTTRGSSTTSS